MPGPGPEQKNVARAGAGIAQNTMMQTGSGDDEGKFHEFMVMDTVVAVVGVEFGGDATNRLVIIRPVELIGNGRVSHGEI